MKQTNNKEYMTSEHNTCAFCRKETSVARQYLHAKNKPTTGNGFDYIYYCGECGLRETVAGNNNTSTPKEWEEELEGRLRNGIAIEFYEIVEFISKTISQEKEKWENENKKRTIGLLEMYFGHISNDGNGKSMNLSEEEMCNDLKKMVEAGNY